MGDSNKKTFNNNIVQLKIMQKRGIFLYLLIFITILNAAAAEELVNDYNSYTSLDFDFSLQGGFRLESTSEKSKVSEVSAYLTFFPRKDILQEASSMDISSTPSATVKQTNGDILFNWAMPKEDSFDFSLNSRITTKNALVIVDSKAAFPLKDVDTFYTEPTEYIDINEDIRRKALDLAGSEDDLYFVAFNVADWIQENIKYDLSTLTADVVQKSSWVLTNREGVCDELTNLFISMMRSLGVPARYVSGVAYTNLGYKFGPHAWAEVYFPDKGWVPFDITYRQFGWLDPSHIKLKVSSDSGDPTIRYTWKSIDTAIKGKRISIDTKVINKGEEIYMPMNIEVRPLVDKAGAGSYVPFEVTLKNHNSYYIPILLTVTKANTLTGKNSQEVLLRPGETKKLFWTAIIPEKLEEGYNYKSAFEVENQFHNNFGANITYSSGYKSISKEEAENIIKEASSLIDAITSNPVSLECSSTSRAFVYETPSIKCKLKNNLNKAVDMNVCAENVCKREYIDSGKEKELELKLPLLKEGVNNVVVNAEFDGNLIKNNLAIDVLSNPDLVISDVFYEKEVRYGSDIKLSLILGVKAPVKDASMTINNKESLKLGDIKNSKKASLVIKSKDVYTKGALLVEIKFKDLNNKEYIIKKEYPVKITNVPWYTKIGAIFKK